MVSVLRSASHEVCGPSSTVQSSESTYAGLPHPLRSVLRVSHPLDGFLLGRSTRPYFMPERSWSSIPFRALSSSGAVTPLGVLMPSCHSPRPLTTGTEILSWLRSLVKVAPAWGLVVWLQGLAPRNELVAIAADFLGRLRARCSPGFPSPSGFALCDPAPWCFHPGSSHELLVVRALYRYDRSHRTLRDRPGSPECSQDRE